MIVVKRTLLTLALLLGAAAAWFWLTMLSPWFYERPTHLAPIEQRSHQVFVYGTLTVAPVRWVVMHGNGDPEAASLAGFRREGLDLARDEAATVSGLLLKVTPQELARLDRYERLGVRYRREEMTLEDGEQAWVYRRLAEPHTHTATAPSRQALIGYSQLAANAARPIVASPVSRIRHES